MDTPALKGPATRDYFAEMYVAGVMADAGWNIYFPRRDKGFDFIVVKEKAAGAVVRPIQVKGKYPELGKGDKPTYGFKGELSALHPDMVLVIVFFEAGLSVHAPTHVAYMPLDRVAPRSRGGFKCEPARIRIGRIEQRRDFAHFFGPAGLERLEECAQRTSVVNLAYE